MAPKEEAHLSLGGLNREDSYGKDIVVEFPRKVEGQDQGQRHEQEELVHLFETFRWDDLMKLIEEHPQVARCRIKMICQGENCFVTPLHLFVSCSKCPVTVLEALVTAYPAAVSTAEPRGGRYPLHMALLKDAAANQIEYLLATWKDATLHADSTGHVPLHLAVEYASDVVIQQVLSACPAAAAMKTSRDRYALHLLTASRCEWNTDEEESLIVSRITVRDIIQAHPEAVKLPDLQGRLPLHLAAGHPSPRWDVLQLLCDEHPEGLLVQDEDHKIPLQLLKRFASCHGTTTTPAEGQLPMDFSGTVASLQNHHYDNDVVSAFLRDRTATEKRKHNVFHKLFTRRTSHKKKPAEAAVAAVDLMNCYG